MRVTATKPGDAPASRPTECPGRWLRGEAGDALPATWLVLEDLSQASLSLGACVVQ